MDYKINKFHQLVENYLLILNKLIDFSKENNLLPFKYIIIIPFIKEYILKNKLTILEYSVQYILEYKDEILNFSLDEYDDIDDDDDDNVSRNNCINYINTVKEKISTSEFKNNINFENNELLEILITIKNNCKNLDDTIIYIIKGYMGLIINILEQMKDIFH